MARFQFPDRPGSHGHPEYRRQDVQRPLLQLCSGIFDHGHGVNDDPQLRNMDAPWHPQLGVAVENLGWISGALAACWTRKSSELSSQQMAPSSRHMCNILLDGCLLLVIWIAIDWFLSSTLRLHSRITPTRPLTLTMFYIWLSFVGEFTFANGESDGLLVLTCTVAVRTEVARIGHRATRDVRRTTEEQALRKALLFRPCWVEDV